MKKLFTLLCLFMFIIAVNPVYSEITVPSNTTVPISVVKKETGKTVASGGTVDAVIVEDVIIDNIKVFKKGDKAILYVLTSKKAGFLGIPGELLISGGKVYDANGEERRIDYNQQIVGEEKTWPKVCLVCGLFIILAPLVLFGFVKGGQAEIQTVAVLNTKTATSFKFKE